MQFPQAFPAVFPRAFPADDNPIAALRATLLAGAAQMTLHPLTIGYMYQDRAGTQPVTASGQLLGRVRDIGGGGYDAVAVSDAARGVLTLSGGKWYLTLSGVNTAYQTAALAAPGVDKAQIFAAIYKASDTVGIVAEISATIQGNAGSCYMVAGEDLASRYSVSSRGSAAASSAAASKWTASGYAPDLAVITGLLDISGDNNVLRRNGVAATAGTADQGTGNYNPSGTYALNFGARNGSGTFMSGRFCGVFPIMRFSAAPLSAAQIAAAEAILTRMLV